ncbi:calcium-binding protein [Aliarcobacter cryaerophilus]|uniref:calcium-binding protein n=1 Tax=Aliarcobacter cryaerophilus TaxID=28198 RepID=UPI000832DA64|nr:calcium-binding protein [Aliarcobacter cryaerophilus]
MVVKNSLKSETIESLSYKISKMETNVFNSLMSVLNKFSYFDGEPTTFTSSKIVFEQYGVKLIVNGKGFTYGDFGKITSVRLIDNANSIDIEVKGEFSDSYYKYISSSITTTIDGKQITFKQTFKNFIIDTSDYFNPIVRIDGVKWSIIDSAGGVLEIDAGSMSFDEYASFDALALEDIILKVDPDYDLSASPVVVVHPDMKFAVANESANNIKVTNNNIGEFKTNSAGDLLIEGFGGNDKISGTSQNDYIDGGVGADVMNGGKGDDTYIVDNIKDKVVEASNQGVDTIITTLNKFSLAKLPNVENLTFDGVVDATLIGNKQNNIIIAGDGHDDLEGGAGNDTLTGGAGGDHFIFNTKLGSTNIDTITDFSSGEDKLVINKKIAKKLSKFTEDNFVYGDKALDSNDYLIFNSENNTLYYDADGSGTKSDAVAIVVVGTKIEFNDIEVE